MSNNCSELACKKCGKQFTRLVGYNRHIAVCGSSTRDYTYEWNSDRIVSNETCKENQPIKLENNQICCEKLEFVENDEKCFENSPNYFYKCSYCDAEFGKEENLKEHSDLCSKRSKKSFECVECFKKFLREKSLIKHQRTIHKTKSPKLEPVKSSEIMRCEACSKKFKAKNSFLRHKNKCKTSFVCTICKKVFIGRRNLVRHENTIHEINLNSHQCLICERKFNRKDNFRRHLESCKNRLVLDFYTCAYCGREFDKKNTLKWHIFRKHWSVNAAKCEICGAQFKGPSSEITLQRHVKEYHIENNSTGNLKCALCVKAFSSRDNILNHIIVEHDITFDHEHLKFSSIDEFKAWKITMEKASTTFFRNRRGSTHSKKYALSIYECHRSGFYKPKTDDRKRRIKLQGTKKMGTYCPAEITLCIRKSDSSCRVSYISMHLGHNVCDENELAHLSVPKDERAEIATKISMGVPYEKILKEHVQSEKDRLYFLSRKDLNNISRAFNVKEKPNVLSHRSSELINIESFMKKHKESIAFFKPLGEISGNDDILNAEDFFLVVMTEKQKEILRKFGSKVVSVDGTFALENCDFLFLTLLVVDDYHEAIPVAFAISNRNDFILVDMFLNCLLKEMGPLKTEIFMSDVERNYHDRWEEIMSSAQNRPFFKWHVPETWRRKFKKIINVEKRSMIRKRLHEITTLLDENLFYSCLNEYLANVDPDLTEFLEELKTLHYDDIENWAHHFRDNSKSNTNIHAESFNRTLKYFYGKLMKTKTLSELLTLIDDYLNFNEFELKRKEIRGVLSHKLSDLRRRHDDCTKEGVMITIEDIHNSGWYVSVTDENSEIADVHFIRECGDICSGCKLYCEKCDTCAQKYQCTCADNVVKNNMCMHIHALSMYLKDGSNPEAKSSASIVNHVQSSTNLFEMSDSEKCIEIMNHHRCPYSKHSKEFIVILGSPPSTSDECDSKKTN